MQIQALTSLVSGVVPDLLPSSMLEFDSQGPAGWQELSRPLAAPGFSMAFPPAWPVCSGIHGTGSAWSHCSILSFAEVPTSPGNLHPFPGKSSPPYKLHCTANCQPVSVFRPRLLNNHANYLPHKYHFSHELNPHYADNLTLEACTLYYLRQLFHLTHFSMKKKNVNAVLHKRQRSK